MDVGIYVRLSKEDLHTENEESESIENQRKMLCEYAIKKGWNIYRIYSDDNESGKYSDEDDARCGFGALIEDAREGRINCVLCKTQSRFSRNAGVVEKYVEHLFPMWGVRFVTVVDNADNFDRRNKKARQINSLVNEWFLEDLSENIKEVYLFKMKRGEYLAPVAPFGYMKDEKVKNHLVPNEKYKNIVKEIFDMYLMGHTGEEIADFLNEKNIPSPKKALGKGENLWRSDSIYRILKNKCYIGTTHQHKEESYSYKSRARRKIPDSEQIEVENTHEAIVERSVFDAVQAKLSVKKKSFTRSKPIFSGVLRCGICKQNMTSNMNGYRKRYYRCRRKDCSATKGISEEFVKIWIKDKKIGEKIYIDATFDNGWNLCVVSTVDDPCNLFENISFPVNEFFPPRQNAFESDNTDCGCNN